ncbi:MAG: metallophosphoesterase [Gemmatimonadaceae bacterium]
MTWCVSLSGLIAGCSRDRSPTPIPPGAPPEELAISGASVVFIGAGDIAVCGTGGDEATGKLVDSVLVADSVARIETEVFTLGDNAYPSGSSGVDNDFPRCFSPSWGSKRIMNVLHTAPGNHDYDSGSGAPYFKYFGARAGPSGKGYYSYDFGGWHLISLNSELYFGAGTPADVAAQEEWLRQDLARNHSLCTIAYWHRPLFSSGTYGASPEVRLLWQILYDGGADLILNGHEHDYERFLSQTPDGVVDSVKGITQIITGTGGGELRKMKTPFARNSVFQLHGRFGVLKLTLAAGEYRHAFIDADGRVWDSGAGKCH